MSKGSAPRPFAVDSDTFGDNWTRIFGNKERDAKDGASENTTKQENSGATAAD